MKSAGKARNNGLYRHIRTSKEIIRNLLNDLSNNKKNKTQERHGYNLFRGTPVFPCYRSCFYFKSVVRLWYLQKGI